MNQINELVSIIHKSSNIALIGHRDGDGDSFGSMLSLRLAINEMGKKAKIISDQSLPPNLDFFNIFEKHAFINEYFFGTDLIIILDTPDLARVSIPSIVIKAKEEGAKVILIDHHQNGDLEQLVDYYYIEQNSCSTCEIIYKILELLRTKIDKKIATYLLTGIETDTTSFQNQNTTSRGLVIASNLIRLGARLNLVTKHSLSSQSFENYKIYGLVLSRLKIHPGTQIAVSYLALSDIYKYDINNNSITGISNSLNVLKNVSMLIIITEEEEGLVKISLRTRNIQIDVGKIAKQFGGGGHTKASGFSINGHLFISNLAVKIV